MRQQPHQRWLGLIVIGCAILFAGQESADAQQMFGNNTQNTRSRQQFQSSWQNRPTVSPYLSMVAASSNNDGSNSGNDLNYFNIVRPRQQAQRAARRVSGELSSVETRLQNLQNPKANQVGAGSLSDAAPISSGRMPPTGHATSFGNLQNYYPSTAQQR